MQGTYSQLKRQHQKSEQNKRQMQAAKGKTYNIKYYIHITKNLFKEETKARKQSNKNSK
jgi:hypothetical protein